jgi:hypothetical protein
MVFFPVEFKGISEEYRAYITHLIIINICIISKQKLLLIFPHGPVLKTKLWDGRRLWFPIAKTSLCSLVMDYPIVICNSCIVWVQPYL